MTLQNWLDSFKPEDDIRDAHIASDRNGLGTFLRLDVLASVGNREL